MVHGKDGHKLMVYEEDLAFVGLFVRKLILLFFGVTFSFNCEAFSQKSVFCKSHPPLPESLCQAGLSNTIHTEFKLQSERSRLQTDKERTVLA